MLSVMFRFSLAIIILILSHLGATAFVTSTQVSESLITSTVQPAEIETTQVDVPLLLGSSLFFGNVVASDSKAILFTEALILLITFTVIRAPPTAL
jgi:hypothetical protein